MISVRDIFSTPHDRPPKWGFVLTAYLDESGHDTKDWVIIAGFLGNADQWEMCAKKWEIGLGHRPALHMNKIRRWSKYATKKLLDILGPIPHECGLTAIVGAVRVSDYQDLVEGTLAEKLTKGYLFCLITVVDSILKCIPKDERIKLLLEQQNEYANQAQAIFENNKDRVTSDGYPIISGIEYIPKESSSLTQPADYLAYAILQDRRDPSSTRAQICRPITQLKQPAFGMIHETEDSRAKIRNVIKNTLQAHPELAARKIDNDVILKK